MTARQFTRDVMGYIREQASTVDEREYDNYLEQLIFEIEEERQKLNWSPDIDE